MRCPRQRGPVALSDSLESRILLAAPSPPSGVFVTPTSATSTIVYWLDNSDNETGFRIERATAAGGPFTQITTAGADVTEYRNTGLSASTTYYYRVRAGNADGDSAYSNVASATTVAATAELIKDD